MSEYDRPLAELSLIGLFAVPFLAALFTPGLSLNERIVIATGSAIGADIYWYFRFPHAAKGPKELPAVPVIEPERNPERVSIPARTASGVVPEMSEPNENQALEKSIRAITDLLSKLENLDVKTNPTLVIGVFDMIRLKLQDFPAPSVIPWNERTRRVIFQVIDLINSLFPPTGLIGWEDRCFDWINVLNLKRDPPTHKLLKTRFLSKVSLYMNDYRFEKSPTMLELFQDLSDYATEPMMALVRTALDEGRVASGDGWKDDRFNEMHPYVSFDVMALKNRDGLQEIGDYLWGQMKQYERSDIVRFKKAQILHDRAERALMT